MTQSTHPSFLDQYYVPSSVHRTQRCKMHPHRRKASNQWEKVGMERTCSPMWHVCSPGETDTMPCELGRVGHSYPKEARTGSQRMGFRTGPVGRSDRGVGWVQCFPGGGTALPRHRSRKEHSREQSCLETKAKSVSQGP